jgi:molecular chaperone GrpE
MNEESQNQPEEVKEETAAGTDSPDEGESGTEQAGPEQAAADEVGALLQKLDQATAEATSHKERYLRTVADLENYRKRAIREKEEARRQATYSIVEDLLPVLDNFKLGLKSAQSHEGGAVFAEGFQMILTQMESALRQNGVEEVNPEGQVFDPNFHEALAHVHHDDIADGHVIEVQRVGYKLHERLLRPAAVIISSGPQAPAETESV